MGKISKKDQDPKQILKDKAQLNDLLGKKSEHFTEGSLILVDGEQAVVLERLATRQLLIEFLYDGRKGFTQDPAWWLK